MLLTLPEGALLPFHEQLMNVPEEPLIEMYTAPPLCSKMKERPKKETEELYIDIKVYVNTV